MVTLSTFEQTSKPVAQEPVNTVITTPETPQADPGAIDLNVPDPTPAATPEPAATPVPEPTSEEPNVSDFSLSVGDEPPLAQPDVKPEPQPSFSLDEELKKVDRSEILKKLGVTDFALELDAYLQKGGKAEDYLMAKAIDYNKVSDEELIKDSLSKEYPGFSKDEINRLFARRFGVNDDMTEDEREGVLLEMKAKGHNIRQEKIKEQSSFKIPEAPILHTDEAYEQWKQEQQSQPELMKKFKQYYNEHEATKSLYESKRVTINLGDGVAPFNFTVDKPEILTAALTDGGQIMNKLMTTPSGEPNVSKQYLAALFNFNQEKFIMDIFRYGQRMGVRQELVEGGQNAIRPQAIVTPIDPAAPPKYKTGTYGGGS